MVISKSEIDLVKFIKLPNLRFVQNFRVYFASSYNCYNLQVHIINNIHPYFPKSTYTKATRSSKLLCPLTPPPHPSPTGYIPISLFSSRAKATIRVATDRRPYNSSHLQFTLLATCINLSQYIRGGGESGIFLNRKFIALYVLTPRRMRG